MTPDRIEEIKKKYKNMDYFTMQHTVGLLLATLDDHGPNGRNYTNEQYITLQQQLVRKTDELTEAQQTIALKQSSIETLTGQVVDETALHAKTAAKLIVAEQTIARLTAALIVERDDALTWDGMGTVRRINEALGEGAKES